MKRSNELHTQPSGSLSELVASIRNELLSANERLYLLLDGARVKRVSDFLRELRAEEWVSLLGASLDTPLLGASPVLISLDGDEKQAARLLKQPQTHGAALLIVSTSTLQDLAESLIRHLYIEERDGTRWMLAFWDPFILASLIGSEATVNALVPGPVLDAAQIGSLMATISCVVFQNREGLLQGITISTSEDVGTCPFVLRQDQIDQLMDMPLPGQVAETLLALDGDNSLNEMLMHRLCCDAIKNARHEGRDTLADYCATALDMLSEKITTENNPT